MNAIAPHARHAKQRQHPWPRQNEYSDEVAFAVNYVRLQATYMWIGMAHLGTATHVR